MERYQDPNDPLNATSYHTGKKCVERGCDRPAGTHWSKFWCQPCNAARLGRISGFLQHEVARYEGAIPSDSMYQSPKSESQEKMPVTPNPKSKLLAGAIVGGAGLSIPPNAAPPTGMAAVVLYVPMDGVVGKSPIDIQADLGLPWCMGDGQPYWFEKPSN